MEVIQTKTSVGDTAAGAPLLINAYHLKGSFPGKTLYIQGGIHGGEVTIWIFQELFNYLAKHEIRGEVILIPIANPVAWNQRIYFSTLGKFDFYMGKDWNRNFPGREDGTLGERIAKKLFDIASKADFIIDLHTSRDSFPFGILSSKNQIPYSKEIGLEYNYMLDLDDPKFSSYRNTLTGQGTLSNIPSIAVECGRHDSYNEGYCTEVTKGLLRLMNHLGIVDDKAIPPTKKPKYYTKLKTYKSPDGGFIKFTKNVGDQYRNGDVLFELINPSNMSMVTKVVAQEDGILQKKSPTHIYMPGDDVLEVLPLTEIKEI